ncbi:SusD/RagB family nutrient-binding outer membrane lipoprotein [Paraflavitalea soli]|uniref:SusD/RagB family nutrient-binding outer membrane lipoprotein n=1 Tax=Paraflavitalea soli TaxID=2315862 RepID=A0A3B7MGN4_9BACT|nr:SusD/RagB family nutrient-binding outer membrane lipoprotein [Paraflavitalea soli]AXY73534.1 SusD/RagB family nutrient-binding outer membrane lipoprotein [Paraflavitalea soli]
MKKLIIVFALPALLMTGCGKSFFDINSNPDVPTTTSITPDLILPAAMARTGIITTNNATNNSFATLGAWMGYWAVGTNYGAVTENRYSMTTDFGNPNWVNNYDIIFDYHTMQQKAEASGQDFYAGIAKIMKSLHYQILVDLFSNVPYSKAMDVKKNITPGYDKGEDIYKDLLKQITDGMDLIKNADASKNIGLTTADIMFHGNKTQWARFGNTLKLRLLIHMSQVAGFNPATEIAAITAEGNGFLTAGQTASVNPGYTNDKPNPYWTAYAFALSGNYSQDYRRANNFALNLMKGLNDERHKYFYRPVRGGTFAGQYRGIDFGLNNDPAHIYTETNLSDIGGSPTIAGGTSGLAKSATMDSWVLTAFESYFLQAEAVARGWMTGNAKTLYEEGVRESFRWLGVPNDVATANTYLGNADARIAWPAATADQIKVIIWQKYFAFNGNNHLEAWSDHRRTGVVQPSISIDAGRLTDHVPTRYLYATSEFSYNAANVQKEGTIDPYTATVFWDR